MKAFGWNWTKSEYPMIVMWIILVLFIFLNQLFRNQLSEYLETWNNYSIIVLFLLMITSAILVVYFSQTSDKIVDERTKKINYKAKNYSWSATYVIVLLVSFIGQIINITYIQVAILIILSMIITQFIFVIYFNRKGDFD